MDVPHRGLAPLAMGRITCHRASMDLPQPLVSATLLRRYKRFLADVRLDDGSEAVAHCANPGSMMGLQAPGSRVWLSRSGPGRKLAYGLELVQADGTLVAINTINPNRIAVEAVRDGLVSGVAAEAALQREVVYGTENSRIDLVATNPDGAASWIEVKNCHLMRQPGLAEFPDSVTTRGAKHLRELARLVEAGQRAVLLFIIQRDDCDRLAFARDIDPGYAGAVRAAAQAGVEVHALRCHVDITSVRAIAPVPVEL